MANTSRLNVTLQGLNALQARLDRLEPALRKRILRPAVTAAARPVRQAAKQGAPVRFGWLKRSLDMKAVSYKETAVAVVGPRSRTQFVRYEKTATGRLIKVVPANYAHLVEFGTTHSRSNPFLQRAWDAQVTAASSKLDEKIREGLERHT